jgi:hypothetical protein
LAAVAVFVDLAVSDFRPVDMMLAKLAPFLVDALSPLADSLMLVALLNQAAAL